MNFNSIMIGTEDVSRLREFYSKLFAAEPTGKIDIKGPSL